jgi:hypothetical protein
MNKKLKKVAGKHRKTIKKRKERIKIEKAKAKPKTAAPAAE